MRQPHFKQLMDEFVEKYICELRNEFWCVCTLINHGHRLCAKPAHTIGIVRIKRTKLWTFFRL